MIANDRELEITFGRIAYFQAQVAHLRQAETNPANYHAAVSSFLAEIFLRLLSRSDNIVP